MNNCKKCTYYAKLLHPDMPFSCFKAQALDNECWLEEQTIDKKLRDEIHKEWIKNHPNWKGTPHIIYWYYADNQKHFDDFIKMYPDAEHAPNDSWKDMYEIIILK